MNSLPPYCERSIADHRQRLIRIDSWLHGPADLFGMCDTCGNSTVALWVDIDEQPNSKEFGDTDTYCRQCWDERRDSIAGRIKTMQHDAEGGAA